MGFPRDGRVTLLEWGFSCLIGRSRILTLVYCARGQCAPAHPSCWCLSIKACAMRSDPSVDRQQSKGAGAAPKKIGVFVSGLIEAGVIDPPLELERNYLQRRFKAQIEPDGTVTCMGRSFDTLVSAASYARCTCTESLGAGSRRLSSNGWAFWQFRNEEGELESISSLRRRFLRS